MKKNNDITLVNGSEQQSTNMQAWPQGYILNGCFVYIVDVAALKREKVIITKKTKAVVCPKWRSVDLDTPEEWVMAEVLYKNKKAIEAKIKNI
jgi:CMP-N-acetylneuraminic acid synthetase